MAPSGAMMEFIPDIKYPFDSWDHDLHASPLAFHGSGRRLARMGIFSFWLY